MKKLLVLILTVCLLTVPGAIAFAEESTDLRGYSDSELLTLLQTNLRKTIDTTHSRQRLQTKVRKTIDTNGLLFRIFEQVCVSFATTLNF